MPQPSARDLTLPREHERGRREHTLDLARDVTRDASGVPRLGRRLRIAVVGPSRHPVVEPYAGGLESFVGGLVDGLRARGHEVLLFAAAGSPGTAPEVLAGGDWQPGELAAGDASMPSADFMAEHHSYLTVMTALRTTYAERVDVVHNNSLHYLPLAMADTLPAPVLTTLHTPPTPWLESALAAGTVASRFAAVSRFTARQWASSVPSCEVVHNGVSPQRWPLGRGGEDLLWFGRIVPEKAPHLAVAAAAAAGRRLRLVGPVGDPAYFASAIAPHLGDDAVYLGHLGGRRLQAAVGEAAAVLVTPVWDEPFGLVMAEAAMSGTPVVAFDRGGVSEVLHPGGSSAMGAVVPAGDVAAMARAVAEVVGLDRRGVRRAAREHLSFEAVVDAYESLYRRVLVEDEVADQVDVAAS